MGTRLSLRPDLDQDVGLLALYVSGNLPNAKPEAAYEGRLKIHNAEWACTAEQIGGDTLPPGSSVFVDNATQQVVVAWPAYAEFVTPLQNPNFESGDLSGWTLTPKGGTATATADTSQKFDGAYSLRWPGGKGLGSEGGIEVEAWNNTIGPCLPGQRVTTHARCMYNPGGHNFGSRYQGLLRFLDGAGMPIGPAVRGRQFKGRGENGRWNDASATGVGPVGTKGVQMGAWLTGSNAPVWLDSASWDVPSSVGINIETTFHLTLRVRDSAGRTAMWAGQITVVHFAPVDLGPTIWMDDVSAVTLDLRPGHAGKVTGWETRGVPDFMTYLNSYGDGPLSIGDALNGARVIRFPALSGRIFNMQPSGGSFVPFASGVNVVWSFVVFRRFALTPPQDWANQYFVDQRCPWSVSFGDPGGQVGGNYGTGRYSMLVDGDGAIRVNSLRVDSLGPVSVVSTAPVAPVGMWVMAMAVCDFVNRTAKIYVNGEVSASASNLWDGSGPTDSTESPYVSVCGRTLNPSGGPSGGSRANYLSNVEVACIMAGNGDEPPTVDEIAGLFAFYRDRFGLV